jgi:uncharacterized caspase-like protein
MSKAPHLLAALALTVTSEIASAENRMALVIGNSAYETVSVLPNPANDAKAMTELLTAAGFEVVSAPNLSQSGMRQAIGNFAGLVSSKGADTVAFVFYAGHGLQVDGENYLVPVDARIQREADVPLQGLRLADLMNTLGTVPSKARIVVLDACRNNPFSEINKTTGRGLAIVDAPTGSLVSYSTAPGTEALDGEAENSPFTAALLKAARQPGVPIEQALKRVRSLVHDATKQQQTPWESSSLTTDFAFFPGAAAAAKPAASGGAPAEAARRAAMRSVDAWRKQFRSRQAAEAYALVIEDGTPEAFEAYIGVYSVAPYAPRVRSLLERRREMIVWYNAVTINTVASYQAFVAAYANSDLTATAQRLLERARNRAFANLPAVAPTCACSLPQPPVREKRASTKKEKQVSRSADDKNKRSKRSKRFVSDDEIDGPPPVPVGGGGPPVSIGIGIPIRGGSFGGGESSVPTRSTPVPVRPTGTQQYRY